ncbi:hypothetical protein H7F51_02880 [Novosphingobium flavum]|uniref:Uncharacterized protein n=1 Tax=Novosphingobium flavum TaxID=1778672 RepID=A0A7X1FP68_9SPHN|nr:hypothetical protein [Novosphingobium flavum]MBC2664459.1 hypothetical protein [Novosphingobium flavum]
MTSQFLAIMASAGLVTAGVAATSETRSASAIPAKMVGMSHAAKVGRAPVARQGNAPDCSIASNQDLPACANPGAGPGAGGGGGVSGGVLAAIAAGLGVTGIVIAAKNDSNG